MEIAAPEDRPRIGDRAPKLDLPEAVTGGPFDIPRQGRRTYVVFLGHGSSCEECEAYRGALAERLPALDAWDGTVIAVIAGSQEEAAKAKEGSAAGFMCLADADRAAHGRFGVPEGGVGLAIVDRFGVIARINGAPDADGLPGADVVEVDVQYLGINCDECVVPESQWRSE